MQNAGALPSDFRASKGRASVPGGAEHGLGRRRVSASTAAARLLLPHVAQSAAGYATALRFGFVHRLVDQYAAVAR